MHLDRKGLEQLAGRLGIFFYFVMLVSFFSAMTGSPGAAFFFLILGATAHVARAAIEEFVARHGRDAQLDLRLPSLSQAKLLQPSRRTTRTRPRR
jgi:hypothetical protein